MIDQTTDLDQAQRELDTEMERLKARQNEITNEKHRRLEERVQAASKAASAMAKEKQQRLKTKHEELVDRCRTAKQELDQLFTEKQTAERLMNSAQRRLADANANVRAHQSSRPNLDDYPSAEQVKQWESKLGEPVDVSAAAEREAGEAYTAYHQARVKHMAAKEAFGLLADQERLLRAEVTPREPWRSTGIFGRRAASIA